MRQKFKMFLRKCKFAILALVVLNIHNCVKSQDIDDYNEVFGNLMNTKPDQSSRAKWEVAPGCGDTMKCVAYYLCSENGIVVKDGSFLIDERLDFSGEPVVDESTSEIVRPSVCPAMEFCCERGGLKTAPLANQCKTYEAPAKCGFRNGRGLGDPVKSIQGTKDYAQYAEFPWVMAVSNSSQFLGGGALIHPKVVLTAAHIVASSERGSLRVRGGEYNTQTKEEICEHVDIDVNSVITHKDFVRRNLQNDVALLVLKKEFSLSASINTVCLPPAGMEFDHKNCVSSGWGKKNFDAKDAFQVFPKKVELPVIAHETCQTMFRESRLGEDFILHKSFLCAGGDKGIDVCTGDGGSPLVCESRTKGHYFVAGIVAGGLACGDENIPGFYVNVANVRDWIDEKLQGLNLTGASL